MGQFDDLAGKAQEMNQQHGDKIEGASDQGLDQAANFANEKTGGKFEDQINQGKQSGDDALGDNNQ